MNISLTWHSEYLESVVSISIVAFGFISYFFISNSKKLHTSFIKKFGEERTLILWIVFQRLTGVVFLGLIPAIIVLSVFPLSFADFGISLKNLLPTLYWIFGLSAIIICMNFFFCRKPDNLSMYPQIRTKVWDRKLILLSASTWIAYLLAYEFMFRGFLLFPCERAFGVWPAIAINASIYAFVHIPKGIKEAVGAIPFGILLCIITFQTETIWAALIIHIVLALSNEWIALYYNPEMSVKKSKISNHSQLNNEMKPQISQMTQINKLLK